MANNCIFLALYCIVLAYLCIFLPDPFQLAGSGTFLYHSSKPYNNRFVCILHCSQTHADSPGYGDPGAPPAPYRVNARARAPIQCARASTQGT